MADFLSAFFASSWQVQLFAGIGLAFVGMWLLVAGFGVYCSAVDFLYEDAHVEERRASVREMNR